ncbi:MAG: acyl carrier protein [Eubacterium sp.]|jgi:acyl carrier protein|nr:acyl carrier protein [Eubacterium sp.]MCI9410889.1 acyl carrier protein [Eubacterium sp.]MCI9537917.1 acyl carrier protein [Eubacterium sp.]
MEKIMEILQGIRPEFDFNSSEDFIEDGYLDSFDLVSLVSELDETFDISIDGLDIIPENFKSLDTITNVVKKNGGNV